MPGRCIISCWLTARTSSKNSLTKYWSLMRCGMNCFNSTPRKRSRHGSAGPHPGSKSNVSNVQPIHGLHPGEVEALQLALRAKALGVLMDDLDGRKAARQLGLSVIGTIGLLERAAEKRLIKLPDAVARLRQTNFFIAPELLDQLLERDRLRREQTRQIQKDPGIEH